MRTLFVALVVVLVALCELAQAQTWDGGGGSSNVNWSTAANWANDTLPISGAPGTTITFAGTARSTVQDLGNPFVLQQLAGPSSGSSQFTISGNPLQFQNLGAPPQISGSVTVNSDIILTADLQVVTTSGTTNLSTIAGNGGLSTSGSVTFSGATSNTYSGATTITPNASLVLHKSGGAIALPGETDVYGTLYWQGNDQIADNAAVKVFGGSLYPASTFGTFHDTIGSLLMQGGTVQNQTSSSYPNQGVITVNGNISSIASTTAATIYSSLDLNGGVRIVDVEDSALETELTIAGQITNGGIVKSGNGTLLLSSSVNNYPGGTTIQGGTLQASYGALQGSVLNNAQIVLTGNTSANISGTGSLVISGGIGLSGSNSYSGGTTIIGTNSNVSGATSSVQGSIVTTEAGQSIAISQPVDGQFIGNISGPGRFSKSGAGMLTVPGPNSFAGIVRITQGGIAIGDNASLSSGAISMFDGTFLRAISGARTIPNQLTTTGAVTFDGANDLTFSNTATFTLANGSTITSSNSATTTLDASIIGAQGSLFVASGGNFAIGNPSSFSGFQTAGDLQVNSNATCTQSLILAASWRSNSGGMGLLS